MIFNKCFKKEIKYFNKIKNLLLLIYFVPIKGLLKIKHQ